MNNKNYIVNKIIAFGVVIYSMMINGPLFLSIALALLTVIVLFSMLNINIDDLEEFGYINKELSSLCFLAITFFIGLTIIFYNIISKIS